MNPQVLYLGRDLFDLGYVMAIPDIMESKGFGRGKLAPSDFTFEVKNIDNQFSIDNMKSFLNGIQWQYKDIKVYDEDELLIFDGIVQNIHRDHESKIAQIICKDKIFLNRKTSIEYESDDWETSIGASKNIMDTYELAYDTKSVQNSINQLTNDECYVKVNINKSDNQTLFQAIQKLGIYGCSDTYTHMNKVYQQYWQAYVGGVSINFDYSKKADCPRTLPAITTLESSMYNDYSIGYNGDSGTPATDENSNNIGVESRNKYGIQQLSEMRCGDGHNQIYYKDKNSAIVIGEAYIRRSHYKLGINAKVLQQQVFDVDYSYKKNIELGYYFAMTCADEGWINKVWDIAGIKKNHKKQNINITAWETA